MNTDDTFFITHNSYLITPPTMHLVVRLALVLAALLPARAWSAALLHEYRLDGTLADQMGGPSLVAAGGTLAPYGYYFSAGRGLSVTGAVASAGNYSIEMFFSLDDVSDYLKLIDFKDRSLDQGIYNHSGVLEIYNLGGGQNQSFFAGQMTHLVLTRDSGNNRVTGYIDGVQQFFFVDAAQLSAFTAPNRIMQFLRDDIESVIENPSGYIDYIRTYNGPLTAAEVTALYAASPPVAGISKVGNAVQLCWRSAAGKTYQVQRRTGLGTNAWSDLGAVQSGTGTNLYLSDTLIGGAGQRFYRVRLGP